MSSVEDLRNCGETVVAEVDESLARKLIEEHFGLEAEAMKQLEGYDDKNFFFIAKENEIAKNFEGISNLKDGFVFKVMNSRDSENVDVVEGMQAVMKHIQARTDVFQIQSWMPSLSGRCFAKVELTRSDGSSAKHLLRVLTYLPGRLLKHISCSKQIFYEAGFKLGKVDFALQSFYHPAFEKYHIIWHTESLPAVRHFIDAVPAEAFSNGLNCRKLISDVIDYFEKVVPPLYPLMTKSQIHGDFNEGNLIVQPIGDRFSLAGLLDFGDTSYSYTAFDIAIAIAYMMIQDQSPEVLPSVDVGGHVLRGYTKSICLNEHDWDAIIPGIGARLAVSLVMGAYSNQLDPSNVYVLFTQQKGWDILSRFWQENFSSVRNRWKKMLEQEPQSTPISSP